MSHSLVAAGIAVRGGRLLLVRRPEGGACPGLWEFPGGKVEDGESPADALTREWKEELGVTVAGAAPYVFATGDGAGQPLVLLFYKVLAFSGEPVPLVATALRWSPPEEAAILAMPPPDAPVLAALLREGNGGFVDTDSPDAPRLVAAAEERDPFIAGSEEVGACRLIRFSKRLGPDGRRLNGILVWSPLGPRAFENLCPHVPVTLDRPGEPTRLEDGKIVCQTHAAVFDAATGLCLSGPCTGESLRSIRLVARGRGWALERLEP